MNLSVMHFIWKLRFLEPSALVLFEIHACTCVIEKGRWNEDIAILPLCISTTILRKTVAKVTITGFYILNYEIMNNLIAITFPLKFSSEKGDGALFLICGYLHHSLCAFKVTLFCASQISEIRLSRNY